MSATLIATVVALVLGHLAPAFAAAVRRYDWYGDWLRWLGRRLGDDAGFWRGRWGAVLALGPPLLAVAVIQNLLDGGLAGFLGLLFGIAVLFYAWGPRDLDRDVDAVIDAADPVARRDAAARLSADGEAPLDAQGLVDAVFRNAVRRWFGVLFWFLLLGPFGAFGYRFLSLTVAAGAAGRMPPQAARGAATVLAALEWPVAQLLTLALALVGNFDSVLGAWRSAGGSGFRLDHRYLYAAARASVHSELAEDRDGPGTGTAAIDSSRPGTLLPGVQGLRELRDAMSLVWRCLLVWLAVLALFVIAGFVS